MCDKFQFLEPIYNFVITEIIPKDLDYVSTTLLNESSQKNITFL